jgi:hypothetical protein
VSSLSNLGVLLNQHYGYRMHYTWDGAIGNRSFEPRFRSYNSVLAFCTSISSGTHRGHVLLYNRPRGILSWRSGNVGRYVVRQGKPLSSVSSYSGLARRTMVHRREKREWHERQWHEADADSVRCPCNVTSMEMVLRK